MFIRTKKIKGNSYAYIVENRWMKKKVRQKVKKYLGRVYRFQKTQDVDFFQYHNIQDSGKYIKKSSKTGIIKDLIKCELKKHDFIQNNSNVWQKDECIINLNTIKIQNKKSKSVALGFNQGLLTEYAVKKLINIKKDENTTYSLAKAFVEAGLDIPRDLFIKYYGKFFKLVDEEGNNDSKTV
ncbi:hypothetical protein KY317_02640 [Candidatus Woesearchaeota archaeon]|nr:hypothetical protein [Candidatus Woesearchaeota archaeon]